MRRRGCLLNWRAIGRAAFFPAIAVAIALAAIQFGYHAESRMPKLDLPDRVGLLPRNPLSFTLAHCQAIGAAARENPLCEAAWAENRQRFLAPDVRLPSLALPHLSGGIATPSSAGQ